MALPGVTRIIKDNIGYNVKVEQRRSEVEAAEKENGTYLKGKMTVNLDVSPELDQDVLLVQAIEAKLKEILDNPRLTHLQLWNEVKSLYSSISGEPENPIVKRTIKID